MSHSNFYDLKKMLRPYPNAVSGKKWAVFQGDRFTVVYYEFTPSEYVMKPESEWTFAEPRPTHTHEFEQLGLQLSGQQNFIIDDEVNEMGELIMALVPSMSVHGGGDWPMYPDENGKFCSLDIFTPIRPNYYEAWLNSPEE